MTRVALTLAALTILASAGAGALAYVSGRRALAEQLARSTELLAASVRSHGEFLADQGLPPEQALSSAWSASRGEEQGLYLCFIGRDGKLNLHTRHRERVGLSVADMQAASPEEAPAVVMDLLRERRSWSGENVTMGGTPQVVSFSYSHPFDALVAVHVPQAVIDARALVGMLPWAYGLGFVALVLLPLALLLMHLAYRRSQGALGEAYAKQAELNKRLVRSERLEAIGRLAGGISHDFNNLLTVVQISADNLREEPLSAAALEEVEGIDAAARKGAQMVQQLLAFGRQPGEHQVIALPPMLAELEGLLRRAAGRAELTLKVDESLGNVCANSSQLEQVLLNLVVNARDASEIGSPIRVEAQSAVFPEPAADVGEPPDQGRWARISVSDQGTGMDSETLLHAFEPFFTTKADGKGTGLGLATAHAVVHQHGGRLTVRSRRGEGTTVTLYLRIVSDAVPALSTAPAGSPDGSQRKVRILLVEDQDDVRAALARLLEHCGHEVVAVPEAATARRRFADHGGRPFEIVVSDVTMPGERGDSLAEALIDSDPHVHVLLVSGQDVPAARRSDDPRIAFLAKPISRHSLDAKLREILG